MSALIEVDLETTAGGFDGVNGQLYRIVQQVTLVLLTPNIMAYWKAQKLTWAQSKVMLLPDD